MSEYYLLQKKYITLSCCDHETKLAWILNLVVSLVGVRPQLLENSHNFLWEFA